MAQLLSAFWIQANLPDNLPSNIEAISDSFILTLIVLRMKVVLFFLVHIDIRSYIPLVLSLLLSCFFTDNIW